MRIGGLVRHRTLKASFANAFGNGVKGFGRRLAKSFGGRVAVDGVDIHTFGADALEGFYPRSNIFLHAVVKRLSVELAREEHGLDLQLTLKLAEGLDQFFDHVTLDGSVYDLDEIFRDGVEFEDVVVDAQEGFSDGGSVAESRIAQNAHLRFGEVVVAQSERIVNDFWEIWVHRRFAISRKGDDVRAFAGALHLLESRFELFGHHLSGWQSRFRAAVDVVTTFAVDAIEGTEFPIGG